MTQQKQKPNSYRVETTLIKLKYGKNVARAFQYFCLQAKAVIWSLRNTQRTQWCTFTDDEVTALYIELPPEDVKIAREIASQWLENVLLEKGIESDA